MGLKTTKGAVNDWSLFRVSGRSTAELLIWPTVATPLTAPTALDDVLLGIDEDANILWAIEQRVDGAELVEPDEPESEEPVRHRPSQVVVTGTRRYRYVPATSVPHHWHPDLNPPMRATGAASFRRAWPTSTSARRTAPAPDEPAPPQPRCPSPTDPFHEIAPGAIPRSGIRIDRRFVLGRRVYGQPLLWVQRRRSPSVRPSRVGAALRRARRNPRDPAIVKAVGGADRAAPCGRALQPVAR